MNCLFFYKNAYIIKALKKGERKCKARMIIIKRLDRKFQN